jgi:ABC-type Mn2+/Zn2+ transport system permease subunit
VVERLRLAVGYAVGIFGYITVLVASSLFDLPTGAVIVVTLVLTFGIATLLARDEIHAPRTAPSNLPH